MTARLTREQAAVIGAYTGYLAGPISDLHAYVERLLGRPVFTHEPRSRRVADEIREASKADFLAIAADTLTDRPDLLAVIDRTADEATT